MGHALDSAWNIHKSIISINNLYVLTIQKNATQFVFTELKKNNFVFESFKLNDCFPLIKREIDKKQKQNVKENNYILKQTKSQERKVLLLF